MSSEKKRIKIKVTDKVASLVDENQFIVCGNEDYDVEFIFDEQWSKYRFKTVLFVFENICIKRVIDGNICEGVAVSETNVVAIGAFSDNIVTTTPAFLDCKLSIKDVAKNTKPQNTVIEEAWNEIIKEIDHLKERVEILEKNGGTQYIFSRVGDYLLLEAADGSSMYAVADDPHINISANALPSSVSNTDNNGVYMNFVRDGSLLSSNFITGDKGIKVTCQNNMMIIAKESVGDVVFLPMGDPTNCVNEFLSANDLPSKFSYYSDGTDGNMIAADTYYGIVIQDYNYRTTINAFKNINEEYYSVYIGYNYIEIFAVNAWEWHNDLRTPPTLIIEGTNTTNVGGRNNVNIVIYTSDRNPYQAK